MNESAQNIAILLFSNSPVEEARRKPDLCPGIFQSLDIHIKKTLSEAPYPVFHYNEKIQKGSSFGQRLSNATGEIFERGFDGVIILGNDASNLRHVDWYGIGQALMEGKAVLGPDYRGGSYLIGLTKNHYEKKEFAELPWETGRLFSALCDLLGYHLEIEKVQDLNNFADLKLAARDIDFLRKIVFIIHWISKKHPARLSIVRHLHLFAYSSRRGPPSLVYL